MKEVIISADGDSFVYLVPNEVADNLDKYCIEFCYNEADFIDYLNKYVFPNQKSVLIKNLGWTDLGNHLPLKYHGHPYFNF